MLHWILHLLMNVRTNMFLAIGLYYVPVVVNFWSYIKEFFETYRRDLEQRTLKYYIPELTIGRIVGWLICTVCPVVNLAAMVCSRLWYLLAGMIDWLTKVLSMPLVPPLR